jgi:hypothetical protein
MGTDMSKDEIGRLKSEVVEKTGHLPEYIVMSESQYSIALDEKDRNVSRQKKGRVIKYRGLAPVVVPDTQEC